MNTKYKNGCLFILSAPSGAGKTTLCRALLKRFSDLTYSVSTTTRKPRRGEKEGIDYFFTDNDTFEKGIEKNLWAEWARVHDNYYGTSKEVIDGIRANGGHVLLDIDVQGARQIMEKYPDAVSVFIMAPSLKELENRLMRRGADDSETICKRLENAKAEIDAKDMYRHVIINDNLDQAKNEIYRLFESYMKNS